MSLSSYFSERRFVDVHFKDGSCISFELWIPLEITLENYNDPNCDESNAIRRDKLEADKMIQEYAEKFISERFNMLTVDYWEY